MSLTALSLAWTLQRPGVASLVSGRAGDSSPTSWPPWR